MSRRQYGFAVAVMAVAGLVGGGLANLLWAPRHVQAQGVVRPAGVRTASEFRVVDAEGKTRGVFGLSAAGNPSVNLFDHEGRVRTGLGLMPDGGAALAFVDKDGTTRLALRVSDTGLCGVELLDAAARARAMLAILPDGSPRLGFFEPDGKNRLSLSLPAEGVSGLMVQDKQARPRVVVGVDARGKATLHAAEGEGKVVWSAP
ncbi:MAG TPA: hypothetical protein VMZ31_19460 [Phycisphaerae bacterium]|nr:hypothetical protein [Phycisphaerae bacterium]